MSKATLLIVPDTLKNQWLSEFNKHCVASALDILTIPEDKKMEMPDITTLLKYDVILISHSRLAHEKKRGFVVYGVPLACRCTYIGSTRVRDCHCEPDRSPYVSPLVKFHFLRVILDEGHLLDMKSSTRLIEILSEIVSDSVWISSGTPMPNVVLPDSKKGCPAQKEQEDLLKIEGIFLNLFNSTSSTSSKSEKRSFRQQFIEPWIKNQPGSQEKILSLFNIIFVRHRKETVQREIALPPLEIKEIPLFMNKHEQLNLNILIAQVKLNFILSEREGIDYIGHVRNQKELRRIVTNLKMAMFFFPGPTIVEEAESSLKNALDEGLRKVTKGKLDIETLTEIIKPLKESQDDTYATLQKLAKILFNVRTAVTQQSLMVDLKEISLISGTSFSVFCKLTSEDTQPEQLADVNEKKRKVVTFAEEPIKRLKQCDSAIDINNYPNPNAQTEKRRVTFAENCMETLSPTEISGESVKAEPINVDVMKDDTNPHPSAASFTVEPAELVGSMSSKLTYVCNEIMKWSGQSKIIVYTSDEFEMSEVYEFCKVARIPVLLFQRRSQSYAEKSNNVTTFNTCDDIRVMIMDVTEGSFGIDLSTASRIYLLRPLLKGSVFQQAIKRAHRMGAKEKVVVETLYFVGSLEEYQAKINSSSTQNDNVEMKADDLTMIEMIDQAPFVKYPFLSVPDLTQKFDPEPQVLLRIKNPHDVAKGSKSLDSENPPSSPSPPSIKDEPSSSSSSSCRSFCILTNK
ncbi:hypothetical protein HDU97_000545 [Phlyctochytrium planicorne]|nr:hypothetical protein HDU97_000545 [Phlyctochytrium planicorne]